MAATTKKPTAAEAKKIKLREEIEANTERVRSLAEAKDAEAIAELVEETDALIGQLPVKERTALRNALAMASEVQEEPPTDAEQSKVIASLETGDWKTVEGAQELVEMGASKIVESVAAHKKFSDFAADLATILYDLWYRMDNKDGLPDLTARSDAAKKAASALYARAGEQLSGDAFEVKQAIDALKRSVQYQRTEVRASFLRALDAPTADLSRFSKLLEKKPADVPVSKWVADAYGVPLKGKKELDREAWAKKNELTSGTTSGEAPADTTRSEGPKGTPDERVTKAVSSIMSAFRAANEEDFDAASEETKARERARLEEIKKAINLMLGALT